MNRFLLAAVLLAIVSGAWAHTLTYVGETHATGPGTGDGNPATPFTDTALWDYCYELNLTSSAPAYSWYISVPDPVASYGANAPWIWAYDGNSKVMVGAYPGVAAPGTYRFWFSSTSPPLPASTDFGGTDLTAGNEIYTNPEPGALVLAGLALGLAAWRRWLA